MFGLIWFTYAYEYITIKAVESDCRSSGVFLSRGREHPVMIGKCRNAHFYIIGRVLQDRPTFFFSPLLYICFHSNYSVCAILWKRWTTESIYIRFSKLDEHNQNLFFSHPCGPFFSFFFLKLIIKGKKNANNDMYLHSTTVTQDRR